MELDGSYRVKAPAETVWSALFDRDVLARAIPGCRELEQTGDTSFRAVVQLKVGPVSARFKGNVELSDIVPPRSCTLTGAGSGGLAGFARGTAKVLLSEAGDDTNLTYTAEAALGGKLAALGSRLITATAKKLAAEFFSNFAAILAEARDEARTRDRV